MGWSSGGKLMEDIILALRHTSATSAERKRFYRMVIRAFEHHDCDVLRVGAGEVEDSKEVRKAIGTKARQLFVKEVTRAQQ